MPTKPAAAMAPTNEPVALGPPAVVALELGEVIAAVSPAVVGDLEIVVDKVLSEVRGQAIASNREFSPRSETILRASCTSEHEDNKWSTFELCPLYQDFNCELKDETSEESGAG